MCGEIYKDRALRAGRTPFRSTMTTRQALSLARQLQFSVLLCAVHREPREYLGDGLGAIICHGVWKASFDSFMLRDGDSFPVSAHVNDTGKALCIGKLCIESNICTARG
jgi:hypothetical protein